MALAALGLPAASAVAAPAAAPPVTAAVQAPTTVTVTGTGSATAAPDMAVLTAGVEVTGPTADQALAAQGTAAKALLAAARTAGVAERDIRTESLALTPVYGDDGGKGDDGDDGDDGEKVTGHRASQTFSLTIRDIDRTGAVIQAVVDAAGDAARIQAVAFDVEDPSALRAKARTAAFKDARAKATQYAKLTGRRLGRLVRLDESDGGRARPVQMPVGAFAKDSVPVAPGRIQDEVSVTAVYELK
ncbi:SIMPL domain-containing protein [Streptomyces sp. NPDC047123]|uniref:SIMPL domain-containing protein n=1 Tax=Streptomyces sp. NPDC047123 TaxID=3155622 RepID=UPI0033C56D1B